MDQDRICLGEGLNSLVL